MNTSEASKQPRPSYENGEPRVPAVAHMIEERGTSRGNFVAIVKKAAKTEREALAKEEIRERKEG